MLKEESTQDSLSMLSQIEMYYSPGSPLLYRGFALRFPLPKAAGQADIEAVMSNRRFLKVFHELRTMPQTEAVTLLRRQIEVAFTQYKKSLAKYMADNRELFKPQVKPSSGPSFHGSDNPDKTPTLLGSRFQVLSLLLLAGNLQAEDLRPVIMEVIQEAEEQRRLLCDSSRTNIPIGVVMLLRGSLYNRQILATALAGTATDPDKAGRVLGELGIAWKNRKLTRYDAAATPYDLLTRAGGPFPADYTKGEVVIRHLDGLSDAKFDRIVDELAHVETD